MRHSLSEEILSFQWRTNIWRFVHSPLLNIPQVHCNSIGWCFGNHFHFSFVFLAETLQIGIGGRQNFGNSSLQNTWRKVWNIMILFISLTQFIPNITILHFHWWFNISLEGEKIIAEVAGTTRDVVEYNFRLCSMPVTLLELTLRLYQRKQWRCKKIDKLLYYFNN